MPTLLKLNRGGLLSKPLLATLVLAPLVALSSPALLALAQPAPEAGVTPSLQPGEAGGVNAAEPQERSSAGPTPEPARERRRPGPVNAPRPSFDQSLDALVRSGVVTAAERRRLLRSGVQRLGLPGTASEACRRGALSDEECRLGFSLRWRGRDGRGLDRIGERYGSDGQPLAPLTVPLIGNATMSSGFGWRLHPLLGNWLMHAGRDMAAPEGTPVVAALDGAVLSSGLAGGYGLAIELEHRNPWRRTLYGHLSELYVRAGDRVRQGEVIGRVGSTGLSTGPHLHFEVRLPADGGWVAVDPGELDPGSGRSRLDPVALLMGQLVQSLERPRRG